jgi:hypothetical protein
VIELVQRRHIIMHAGGRVSRRYLSKVSHHLVAELHGDPQLGATTALNKAYVDAALDRVEVLGTNLAFNVWVRLQPKETGQCGTILTEWLYDRLLEGRWSVALPIARAGASSARLIQSTQLVCRMNEWLCYKRLGRFDEVRSDVETMDLSAMDDTYRLARLALLDRETAFFELIERTKGGGLEKRAWTEWPILDELRQTERFREYAVRYAAEQTPSVPAVGLQLNVEAPQLGSGEAASKPDDREVDGAIENVPPEHSATDANKLPEF